MSLMINAVEQGFVPEPVVRLGIRNLIGKRLKEISSDPEFHRNRILDKLNETPIAIETQAANKQHYELPADFFFLALGENLKYSCAYYEQDEYTLEQAEVRMLELYCERAQLEDGMDILELGCGWGSMTLFLAKKYPNSTITAISNSNGQREYIESVLLSRGIDNVKIITTDINEFSIDKKFDRIMSIEMFEHVRNYKSLFARVSSWLKDEGKVFIHIFCHREATYFFETEGEDNWMGRYFFTGGVMPGFDLFERVQDSLKLDQKWKVNGKHYQKTSEDWFSNMDARKQSIMEVMSRTYGEKDAHLWFNRWKIFFGSCAELFGYNDGEEWFVGHYLFSKK